MRLVHIDDAQPGLPPRDAKSNPMELFRRANEEIRPLYIVAPMVRYTKLPFRALVRQYNADMVYTPMTLAKEFLHPKARAAEFSTDVGDRPLITQFAAADPVTLGQAAELVAPFCDGIGLNCGCPQSWACQEGLGYHLMGQPDLVRSMIRRLKDVCGEDYPVSIKIRIHKNIQSTVEFTRMAERAGVDWIDVHGRLKNQSSKEPPHVEAMKIIAESVNVPVVANGDVFNLQDAGDLAEASGAAGVMAARGILLNPALFAGYAHTPWSAVELFLQYVGAYGMPTRLVVHHLSEMMACMTTKAERSQLHMLKTNEDCVSWLDSHFILRRPGDVDFAKIDDPIRVCNEAGAH